MSEWVNERMGELVKWARTMKGLTSGGVLLALWLLPATAAGQTQPLVLRLDDAIERALARAPAVAEARARERAATWQAEAGRALRVPTLSASTSLLRTNHVDEYGVLQPDGTRTVIFPDIPSNYRVRFEAAVPIYLGGRPEAAVNAAGAEARAAAADRRAAEADVRLAVTSAYWRTVTSQEAVHVRERALARTDAWVADVQARVDVGVAPPNDVQSARAERARQLVQLIDARSAAALAAVDLAQLIGADLGTSFDLRSPVGAADAEAGALARLSAEALLAESLARRAERQGLQARAEALRASARGAAAATRPHVAAVAAVEPARPNRRFVPPSDVWNTGWDLGLSVTWTVFDGGRARAEQAAAEAQASAVVERVREFDDRLAVDVRRRQLEIESAQAALEAAAEGVAAAAEARRVVGERFAAGVAGSTDVLDAEVALLDAELQQTSLQAALRMAEARLIRLVGGA
jgi:outer membrane protein